MFNYSASTNRLSLRPIIGRVLPYTLNNYGVAVVSVELATLLTWLLHSMLVSTLAPLFYAAVATSTWYGGLWSGLLGIALSTLSINHFLQKASGLDHWVSLVVFVLVALFISFLIAALRSAKQQAEMVLTKQKASEDALRETQALFESFMSHSPTTAFIKDHAGRYIYVNQYLERLFNRKRANWLGKTDFDLFPSQAAQQWRHNDLTVLSTGQAMQTLETVSHHDGEHYYMSFKFPVIAISGQRLVAGICIDITEQKRLETERNHLLVREQEARRQAEVANRTKDEFLAVVSHDLRTPLSAILGWAELLRMRQFDPGMISQAIKSIERNAKAQKQLIEDLLDTTRIVQGQMHLHSRPTSLLQVISAALDTVRLTASTKRIQIESRLEPIGLVIADSDRLQQVFWNLLSNAVQFTPEGGRVLVRLERVDNCAQITVTDTGKGISPDFLPYVFERFHQAETPTNRTQDGLGLGLAIARQLVELHQGTIQAKSPGLGQGAIFIVQLPLMTNCSQLTSSRSANPEYRI
ncbi:MAG: PAS domain-containing protein [Chroococcidiopsidaceae cyanobacterium CP_BM_RX_35]|nr:PAS domain-containing protein [Chroococcidiopsidaceae cyanobacterium CP_BM_RX_35]